MDSASQPWRQLGTVLVDAGLLTESQLASALDDQQRTGRKLGEIIVDRGFVSSAAIANALAEQHGHVLKTEYGFGTGLRSLIDRRRRSAAGETAPAAIPAPVPAQAQPDQQPATDPPPLLRGPSEARPQATPEPAGKPEPAAGLGSPPPALEPDPEPEPEPELEPSRDVQRLEDLVNALAQRDAYVEELRERLEAQGVELASARARLEEMDRELEELKEAQRPEPVVVQERALPTQPPAPATPEPAANGGNGDATSYLLCIPNASGFMLLERSGAAPPVGTELDLPEDPESRFRVTKVVRSVSSPTARPTAYLRRL